MNTKENCSVYLHTKQGNLTNNLTCKEYNASFVEVAAKLSGGRKRRRHTTSTNTQK